MPYMRLWLHEGLGEAEPGYRAWGLDHLGFATWASTRDNVLEMVAAKFDRYRTWLATRGLGGADPDPGVDVVEVRTGDEILFTPDEDEATPAEIDRTLEFLAASRKDLMAMCERAPEGGLDWDPPYRNFAPWASWRSGGWCGTSCCTRRASDAYSGRTQQHGLEAPRSDVIGRGR
jgi:hypothetical protein